MPCRFVCTTHTPYCMYCKRASSFYYSSGTSVFTVCHRRRHHRHYRTYPLGRAISHEHHLPASALEGVVCVQILELQHVIHERRFRYDKKSSYVIVVRRAYLFGLTTRSRIDVYTRNDSFARLRLRVEVLRYLEEMMRERYCGSVSVRNYLVACTIVGSLRFDICLTVAIRCGYFQELYNGPRGFHGGLQHLRGAWIAPACSAQRSR